MKYTIATQGEPRRGLYYITNLENARKGAQMLANARNVYTVLFHPCTVEAWARKEFFKPAGAREWTSGEYRADTETLRRQGAPAPSFRSFATYQKECGRNCALAVAALRLIAKRAGKRLVAYKGELREANTFEYFAQVRAFMRPGAAIVRVLHDYSGGWGTAGKLNSGGISLVCNFGGLDACSHTFFQDAHPVSSIPAPMAERREESIWEIRRPALGTKAA